MRRFNIMLLKEPDRSKLSVSINIARPTALKERCTRKMRGQIQTAPLPSGASQFYDLGFCDKLRANSSGHLFLVAQAEAKSHRLVRVHTFSTSSWQPFKD